MSEVESPRAIRAAILTSVGLSASRPPGSARRPRGAGPDRSRAAPAPQAGRRRPGGPGFQRGLGRAGLRRGPRQLGVVRGDREPHQVGQPLMGQGHLPVVPGQDRGQHQPGLAEVAALLQRQRVRGGQEVPVLPVGDGLDGQRQPGAQLPADLRALVPAPGDERGHAVHQQRGPAFAQEGIGQPGGVLVIQAQFGQRVVPLAEPVPQHGRGRPGPAIRTPAAAGDLASLVQGLFGVGPAVQVLQREDAHLERVGAQIRVAGVVAERAQRRSR
jgi:hypothetical protein